MARTKIIGNVKIKRETGKKKKRNPIRGEYDNPWSNLLGDIIDYHGGAAAIAKIGRHPVTLKPYTLQNWLNWRVRGEVPLMHVEQLSELLDITPFALNNTTYPKYKGELARTMTRIVKDLPWMSNEDKKKLIELEKVYNEKQEKIAKTEEPPKPRKKGKNETAYLI